MHSIAHVVPIVKMGLDLFRIAKDGKAYGLSAMSIHARDLQSDPLFSGNIRMVWNRNLKAALEGCKISYAYIQMYIELAEQGKKEAEKYNACREAHFEEVREARLCREYDLE